MSADEFPEFDELLSPEEIAELDRRADKALEHPESGRPLAEVFAEIGQALRAG